MGIGDWRTSVRAVVGTFVLAGQLAIVGGTATPAAAQEVPTGEADLAITSSRQPAGDVAVGEEAAFTFEVQNMGPDTATNTLVFGRVPGPEEGWTVGAANASVGSCATTDGTGGFRCDLGDVAPSSSVTIVARSTPELPGHWATASAVAHSDATDPNESNDSTHLSLRATGDYPSLAVNGWAEPPRVLPGGSTELRFDVRNDGTIPADGVVASVPLPSRATLDSAVRQLTSETSPCAVSDTAITCELGTLPAQGWAAVMLELTADPDLTAGDVVEATATVSTTTAGDPTAEDDSDTATSAVVDVAADLSLEVAGAPDAPMEVGSTASLQFTVHNAGPDAAEMTELTASLPSAEDGWEVSELVPSSGTCAAPYEWGYVECALGSIAPGGSVTVDVVVNATLGGRTGWLSLGVEDASSADPVLDDNRRTVQLSTVAAEADLAIAVERTTQEPFHFGTPVEYVVTAANLGPGGTESTSITVNVPGADFDVVGTGPSGACQRVSDQTLRCELGALPVAGEATATVTVTPQVVAQTGWIGFRVDDAHTTDPEESNDSTFQQLEVQGYDADLKVELIEQPPAGVTPGMSVAYVFDVTNQGPQDVPGVDLSGRAPAPDNGADPGTIEVSQGTCSAPTTGGDFTCELGPLAAGAKVRLTTSGVASGDSQWISAWLSASGVQTSERDWNDNSASAWTEVGSPVLSMTGGASPDRVNEGGTARFVFDVQNSGNVIVDDAVISAALPVGVTFASAAVDGVDVDCGVSEGELRCSAGPLAAWGGTEPSDRTVTLLLQLDGGQPAGSTVELAFIATPVTGGTAYEPVTVTTSVAVVEPATVLRWPSLWSPYSDVAEGSLLHLEAQVWAEGGNATDVQMTDQLPAGLTLEGYEITRDGGSWGETSCEITDVVTNELTCELGTLAGNQGFANLVLHLRLAPDAYLPGDVISTQATFSAANASPASSDELSVSVVADESDLSVWAALRWESTPVETGDQPEIDIEIYNSGPADARDVRVRATVPSGFGFIGARRSDTDEPLHCAADLGTSSVSCELGLMERGGYVPIRMTLSAPDQPATAQQLTFEADAAQPDPYAENDVSLVEFDVVSHEADLGVSVSGPATSHVDDVDRWFVSVENAGPGRADDVVVQVVVPEGLSAPIPGSVFGAVGAEGTCVTEGRVITCTYEEISVQTGAIRFDATIQQTGTHQVTASVTSSSPEPPEAVLPNEGSATTTVSEADLSVRIVEVEDVVELGAPYVYRIEVANVGGQYANEVTLDANVPAGIVQYVRAVTDSSTATDDPDGLSCGVDGSQLSCSASRVRGGTSETVEISVLPDAIGPIEVQASTDFARIHEEALDDNSAVATAEVVATTGPAAIRRDPGFVAETLPGDDTSIVVALPFAIDWFGQELTQVTVYRDGFVGLGTNGGEIEGHQITTRTTAEDEHKVQYGEGLVDGRPAFGITWEYVRQRACTSYWCGFADLKNSFQIVIIDRSDLGDGLYDVELNYGHLHSGFGGAGLVPGFGEAEYRLPGSGSNETRDTAASGGLIAGTANADGQLGRYLHRLGSTSDLAIEASAPDTAIAGEVVDTTFTVTNDGPDRAWGTLVVPKPEGAWYQAATTETSTCTTRSGNLECSIELVAGASEIVTVQHLVDPGRRTPITVAGRIESLGLDPDPVDDDASAAVEVAAVADLRIDLASDSADPIVYRESDAETTTHRYRVRNEGPSTALEPEVTVEIPAGLDLVDAPAACAAPVDATLTCTFGALAPRASTGELLFTLRAASLGDHSTTVHATAAETDPLPSDNTAFITTSVVADEVDLQAWAANDQTGSVLVVGETGTFDLRAHNHGPATAEATTLTAQFPPEVRVVGIVEESTPGACAISDSTVSCEFGAIADGSAGRVVVEVEGLSPGPADDDGTPLSVQALVDVASANPEVPDERFANSENHHFYVVPPAVDLQALATTIPHGHVGVTQEYRVGVFNGGIAEADGVRIEATLPPELRIDWLFDPGAGVVCDPIVDQRVQCTVQTLPRHEYATIRLDVTPIETAAAALGSVVVSSPSTDADPSNDTTTLTTKLSTVPTASLTVAPTSGAYPLEVSAEVSGDDLEGDALSYELYWGDGYVSSGPLPAPSAPTHTYQRDGSFRPLLVVFDGGPEVGRSVAAVEVHPPSPLRADAGPDLVTTANDPGGVTLDGSGSSPAPSIRSYRWRVTGPGTDRSFTGDVIRELTLAEGTYQASLTVESATESSTDVAIITVDAEAPALAVDVSDTSGVPVPSADVVVVDDDGGRHSARTSSTGRAQLFGLVPGSHSIYVAKKGFVPAKVIGTVTGGADVVEVELASGDVATATLKADRLTPEEAEAAGIDINDPANSHVVQFDIHLGFQRYGGDPVRFSGYLTRGGFWGASIGGRSCFAICRYPLGSGGTLVVSSSFVGDHPQILYMVIPVKARWLKEFYDVSLTVQNLAPEGFTLTGGTARLSIPQTDEGPAFALPALFGQSQTNPQPVPDIPGGQSRTVHWIARGDVAGLYDLAAEYAAVLDPLELPVTLLAQTAEPVKVWGVDAVRPRVVAEDKASYRDPYRLTIELCNVTDAEPAYSTPVHNLSFELLEEGTEHQIYQGGQQLLYGPYPEIGPGDCTPPAEVRVFPDFSGVLVTELSFVEMKGAGEVARGGEFLTSIPASQGRPSLLARPVVKGVQLAWDPVPGDELGYEVWKTSASQDPEPLTEWEHFPRTPAMIVPPGVHSVFVPGQTGDEFEYSVRPIGQHTVHPLVGETVVNFPPTWLVGAARNGTPKDGARFDVKPGETAHFSVGATDPEGTDVEITWEVIRADGMFGDESLAGFSCTPAGEWFDCTIAPTEEKTVKVRFSAVDGEGMSADDRTFLIDTSRHFTYVALGDSFSAGEGVDPYFKDHKALEGEPTSPHYDNRCHRSSRAYPTYVRPPGFDRGTLYEIASGATNDPPVHEGDGRGERKYGSEENVRWSDNVKWAFWACSGAVTKNVWEEEQETSGDDFRDRHPQLDGKDSSGEGIDYQTDLVTMTIGGNDVDFVDVLKSCAFSNCYEGGEKGAAYQQKAREIDDLASSIATVVRKVKARTGNARLLVLGYPHLFPADESEQQCLSLSRFWSGEMNVLRSLTARANKVIGEAAEGAGAEFVPVTEEFAHHEPCGNKGAWLNDWNVSARDGMDHESFHPKWIGQQAYASIVNEYLGSAAPLPKNERSIAPNASQTIRYLLTTPTGMSRRLMLQTVWPGSDIVTTLVSPSGRRIDRDTFAEDVVHIVGPTYERYEVTDPEPGVWTVEHFGADVAPEGEPYQVEMWAEAEDGSSLPLEAPLPPRAVAKASVVEGEAPLPIQFDATLSADTDGSVVSYEWDFGDGTTASGSEVSHTFASRGRFTVTLTVTDDTGMSDTDTIPVGAVAPTSMDLSSSTNAPVVGEAVTYGATVIPSDATGVPTGLVTFRRDGVVIEGCSSQPVDESTGAARCETVQPPVSTSPMVVSAVYSGDELFGQSTDSLEQVVVDADGGGGGGGGTGGGGGGGTGGGDGSPTGDTVTDEPVTAGGTVSTSDGVVDVEDPIDVSVTSPVAGEVTIAETGRAPGAKDGYRLFGQVVEVEAPDATPSEPLELTFEVHASLRNGNQPIRVFRNGKRVASCQTTDGTASPDPCVVEVISDGDVVQITVLSSHASEWTFGERTGLAVDRAAGRDRIETAVAISRSAFERADNVVLARADDYADSLAGGPLAARLRGPVLLTDRSTLPQVVAEEIRRLGADSVTVLGGAGAIRTEVDAELRGLGVDVDRISGSDRFDTAARIAAQLPSDVAYLVDGAGSGGRAGWADALSVSVVAARLGRPILLTDGDELPGPTRRVLEAGARRRAIVVGGTDAVPAAVLEEIRRMGVTTQRVAGADRYSTSVLVADHGLTSGMEASFLWVASGGAFADALAGGPAANWRGGSLLLVPATGSLPPATTAWLKERGSEVEELTVLGGPVAIDDEVEEDLRSLLVGAQGSGTSSG